MTEKMVRLVVMLPRPVLQELERVAAAQGLSRSGLIRVVMIRHLRGAGSQIGAQIGLPEPERGE